MSAQKPDRTSDPLFVDAVEKAFRVVEAFSARAPELSLTELCKATGMNKSSVQRFTHTLTRLGYLDKCEATRRYRLSPKVLESANDFLTVDPLVNRALPHIMELRRRVAMRVGMGCLRGEHAMYLVPLQSNQAAFNTANPGFRVPSYCSSTGRVLLAFLDPDEARRIIMASDLKMQTPFTITDVEALMAELRQIVNRGYCITSNELVLGDANIAAPIRDATGRAVATVTASGAESAWDRSRLVAEVAPLILEAAQAISSAR